MNNDEFMEKNGEHVLTAMRHMVDFWIDAFGKTTTPHERDLAADALNSWQKIRDEAIATVEGESEDERDHRETLPGREAHVTYDPDKGTTKPEEETFEDIQDAQGWNADSVAVVLMDFIDNYADKGALIRFARERANEENS